ncbi:glycosyltransferase family 1 protein [Faecalimonas canis]
MIRILHVVTHMNRGGLETMIMNYYRNIDREKIQFDFLVHRQEKADYDEEILSMGGIIYRISRLNPFDRGYRKELETFFEQHKEYQTVHVHQDCMSSIILKVAKKCGVKVRIAHSHSSSQDKDIKYPIKLIYRYFIPKYATHLMACSDAAGKWMFRSTKFEIVNNAIDSKIYSFDKIKRRSIREKLGIQSDEFLIGHVGRFCYPKNHHFLIDIFYELNKKIPAKLILVGEGELRTETEEKVKKLGLKERVIFTGLRSDVSDLLQTMDVFVFPSHYEGFPVTLIEAQAAGLPCLISDGVPIECKKTSLVEQELLSRSADEWAEDILRLKTIPRRNTYQDIVKAGYDIQENARRLSKIYEEMSR